MMTGSFGTTAISALTAQNTHGVTAIHSAPIDHFKSQMTAVLSGEALFPVSGTQSK